MDPRLEAEGGVLKNAIRNSGEALGESSTLNWRNGSRIDANTGAVVDHDIHIVTASG